MSEQKKIILFLYTEYTVPSTVSLMKRLLNMFPEDIYDRRMLLLTGDRPDRVFQDYAKPIQRHLHLIFSFDCLGFVFRLFDDTPYFNTFWTPCATLLTLPATELKRELSMEMNLNITLLCLSRNEQKYIETYYPQYDDVRTVENPARDLVPIFGVLTELAERYPLLGSLKND